MQTTIRFGLGILVCAVTAVGCRSLYYSTMEIFGKEKRDILKSNVEAARDDQKAASEQFKDALTNLKELYGFDGGQLEKVYTSLKRDHERCEARAQTVRARIKKVEVVASDLFREWAAEIETMTSEKLKADSRLKLDATQDKFGELQAAMKKAEASMEPVLVQFRDQVLYFKHNLNAQAIGSLRSETQDIEKEIAKLISDMNASIAQADAFIENLP